MDSSSGQKQHLALRVALDTMKDRCILQQKRLTEVEEENQELREQLEHYKQTAGAGASGLPENVQQLRLQVGELQRMNEKLNAHIGMVSAENRKLWSRLSQIAKDQSSKTTKDNDNTLTASDMDVSTANSEGSPRGGLNNQNLIRSKTFTLKTANLPNPNLRQKLIPAENFGSSDMRDISLEDGVALEVYGDGEGNGVECVNKQPSVNEEGISEAAMAFSYLNVDSSNASQDQDFNAETKKCIEGLGVMRREAMKQQKELNAVFALLESRIALQPCAECVKKSNKPEMADKSLETDESFNDSKYANNHQDTNNYTSDTTAIISNGVGHNTNTSTPQQPLQMDHLNIIQEKILADEANKICPMCGKIYDSSITFESFCEHVEDHFRDESIDSLLSMDNKFEMISHTVGDF
ncbi:C2H2-type zinc binding domain-containing protein spindle-F [Haematobia irritans]|uniref:C2H2-type zinc binding domain-containing protein spindle-F n=1 Tax=Haematobia irritans TaxID=7368 RepID=UPI003F50C3D5